MAELTSGIDNRPQLQSNTSQHSATPVQIQFDDGHSSSITSDLSEPTTAIRWSTPASRRLLTPPVSPSKASASSAVEYSRSTGINEAYDAPMSPQVVRFDEEQIRSMEAEASDRPRMRDIDLDSGPPTPSIDDTPYIRYAIEQLTRAEDCRVLESPATGSSLDSWPVHRVLQDQGLGYVLPQRSEELRKDLAAARREANAKRDAAERGDTAERGDAAKRGDAAERGDVAVRGDAPERRDQAGSLDEGGLFKFNPTRPLSNHSNLTPTGVNRDIKHRASSNSDFLIPVSPPTNTPRYPDLTFAPMILRPVSMITLSFLCLLMIVAIMFCAIYSTHHNGLVKYAGGIYGGRYFVFGFLPQIFAACIYVYVQSVLDSMTRIMPYVLMAMEDPDSREDALFLDIYPRSLSLPRWNGYTGIGICNLCLWLTIFTIPLQSCLFSVIPVAGGWRWTTVQGVAWTLVIIYIIIMAATVFVCIFFYHRTTGLMWDPRSLADMISLLPRSNSLREFPGTDTMRNKEEIRDKLAFRSDRLGYWRTLDRTKAMFYCIGEIGASTRRYKLSDGKLHEKLGAEVYHSKDVESVADLYSSHTRFRYIPWYISDNLVIFWSVAAFVILLALIIVSFLPSTALRKGFLPHVSTLPNSAGFSPANFLYSFIPSLLGILLYAFFRPLDMAFRKLQPWAELAHSEGATAERSLLLDYPAALPVSCTISAFSAGHYRVAILSLLSFLFVLLPVLSGGLFFALTTPSGSVRMIPNLASFYVLLILLILYVLGLCLLIPNRHAMHLPHDVNCLAEIISFVHGSGILDDPPFMAPRTKADLVTRLMAVQRGGVEARFAFGVYMGRHGKECLGIEKIGRSGAREVMVLSGR